MAEVNETEKAVVIGVFFIVLIAFGFAFGSRDDVGHIVTVAYLSLHTLMMLFLCIWFHRMEKRQARLDRLMGSLYEEDGMLRTEARATVERLRGIVREFTGD